MSAAQAATATTATAVPGTVADRIERRIDVRAPRSRVFQALADAQSFGQWFGVDLGGQRFAAGERTRARFTKAGCEALWFDVQVARVEPPSCFAFHWHPGAVDPSHDYTQEECTLVTFTLDELPGGGTRITVVESGFDRVPPQRRFEAFQLNDRGWAFQLDRIAAHVDGPRDG